MLLIDVIRQWFLRRIKDVGDGLLFIKNMIWSYKNYLSKILIGVILVTATLSSLCYSKPLSVSEILKTSKDIRSLKLNKFLQKYKSPLIGHEQEIVYCANKFNLDYRLYVAISGCESTFGLRCIPNYYNFTGIGSGYIRFKSVYDNIYQTSKLIATHNAYTKYRRTGIIEDLVYPYKGVPPYKHYITNIHYIMNQIEKM